MPKTRKFIDRKKAVTFHLVHRSQQDPLIVDEKAPQHVLVPAADKQSKNDDKRKEEQRKFGVFFDDDYNYLQHLKDVNQTSVEWEPVDESFRISKNELKQNSKENFQTKIQLPSSVFASKVEEDVGLLNKAAPTGLRLDVDIDVVAAMDEDFDYDDPENQLEDNFMDLANAEHGDDEDVDSMENSGSIYNSENEDELGSLDGKKMFAKEETRSRFTDYSMSSSVLSRSSHLQLLDDKFEQMFAGYDDAEIGALEDEEIEGSNQRDDPNDLIEQIVSKNNKFDKPEKEATLRLAEKILEKEDENEEDFIRMKVKEKTAWDCESIISTYSNHYNHPKLIEFPKKSKITISSKTGIPKNTLGSGGDKLTVKALAQFNKETNNKNESRDGAETVLSTLSLLSIRDKNETLEEKKHRKHLLKDYRNCRRQIKKANSEAFKEELIRQEKVIATNKKNVQGIKLV